MNEVAAPLIRFRHAADAIGVTKKTLRNWLVRGQVSLQQGEVDGWAVFSRIDLITLSFTAELVKYGMTVIPAFQTAASHVGAATWLLTRHKNTPAGALLPAFKGWRLIVSSPAPQKWRCQSLKPLEDPNLDEGASLLVIFSDLLVQEMLSRLELSLDADDESQSDRDSDEEWTAAGVDTETEDALRNLTETIKNATPKT